MSESIVCLISSEGEAFNVSLNIAKISGLVSRNVEEAATDEEVEIKLPNVNSSILTKVIEFFRHYQFEELIEIEKVTDIFSNPSS
jgi:hypothetical protein